MSRHFDDWIQAFLEYSDHGEAPKHMRFWTAVSTVAGALRRKVWIDQAYFRWFPNFYVILVAPPGIVAKSTTADVGMKLLRRVPGIHFGPDVTTMQSLVTSFAEAAEAFELNGEYIPMSAITLESSELGNLLNPQDTEMVDLLVRLWDGKQGKFEKKTKHSGSDSAENPWINLIGCTTPAWIAGNFPDYLIGGGFTSRCVFVYAEKKAKFVAYPGLSVPESMAATEQKLVDDLCAISNMAGEFRLSSDAIRWGTAWYEKLFTERPANLDDDRFGGYIARKQTHLHKLCMVLAASQGDNLLITDEHMFIADTMLKDLEPDMAMVFSKIGKTEASTHIDRLVEYIRKRGVAGVPYTEVYRYVHSYFPSMRDFEDMIAGAVKAGFIRVHHAGTIPMVYPVYGEPETETAEIPSAA